MSDPLKVNEIDSDIRVEYVNAFRAYSGPGVYSELGFVDIASSVKSRGGGAAIAISTPSFAANLFCGQNRCQC